MADSEIGRRDILRRGGQLAGGGIIAALAGCNTDGGSPTDTATRQESAIQSPGTTEKPTPTPRPTVSRWEGPSYARWMPPAGTFTDTDHYGFSAWELEDFADRGSLPKGLQQQVEAWKPVDVDWRNVSMSLYFQRNFVIKGDNDAQALIDDIDRRYQWSVDSEYRGYDILRREDGGRAVGISDTTVLISDPQPEDESIVDNVETLIDAGTRRMERYVRSSDDMGDLVRYLGVASIISGGTMDPPEDPAPSEGRFEAQVGEGKRGQLKQNAVDVTYMVLYHQEEDVDLDALRTYFDANDGSDGAGGTFAGWSDVEFYQDGRAGVIAGTVRK